MKSDIEQIKKMIQTYARGHSKYIRNCKEAERYYRNDNDILHSPPKRTAEDPLRNADNRIPRNFHGLLVNQKASYAFTAPPLFDVGTKATNVKISDILGDGYAKACKDLCVNASNCKVAWLHYWIDEKTKEFRYGVIDSRQIVPVFSSDLNRRLIAVFRNYKILDEIDGKEVIVWEYWTDTEVYAFRAKSRSFSEIDIQPYDMFSNSPEDAEKYKMTHDFGEVPFIPFYNNNANKSDLDDIKPLIDAYDKVFSGFLNDLEDTQEIVYVLTNYGGADLDEFLSELKKYKAIKIDKDDTNNSGGVETLTINIPIEARKEFLETTRKAIFEQGQGVDPDPRNFGNSSGVALKYLYSLLELKTGLMETEFRLGFGQLIRAICKYAGIECKRIIQTWTRTAVTNDAELADICVKSVGLVSNKTILKNSPIVEDADREEEQLKKEKKEEEEEADIYQTGFKPKEGEEVDEQEQETK